MISTKINSIDISNTFLQKARLYFDLLKFRLSFLVAFSASFGYLLAIKGKIDWICFLGLSLGGFLVSGASIVINQVLEKDVDKLMKRTNQRPLPTDKLSLSEAITYGFLVGVAGFTLLLIFTNFLTAVLAFLSMILYGFVYTPLKKIGPVAVFVGAIPGALPPLLGWVAASGTISYEAVIIFALQFFWQFPHFWAIAWVMDEDYQKAGFKLLPSEGGKNFASALQIVIYTFILIPIGWLPMYLGITGLASALIATLCGIFFLVPAVCLLKSPNRKLALQIMFGSFLYLPIVQIAFLMDKV